MRFPGVTLVLLLAPLGVQARTPRPFDVLCREAWGAGKAAGPYVRHQVKHLTVHHSGVALGDNRRAPRRILSAQRYHQRRGWPDIAYHFLVDRAGNIYEGRPVRVRGDTGTRYDTTGHFLVCLVENHDEQPVLPRQLDALVNLLAWASARHEVSPAAIRGHGQLARTSCPGKKLRALIDDGTITRRVRQTLAAGGVRLRGVCGAEGKRHVAAIRRGR